MRAVIEKERQTSADVAFDYLEGEILSLGLLPGSKISEAEIAAKLGLSRQPVREAFGRLATAGLLLIRPQKVTIVRKFSLERIASARFTRRAVELEVLHQAILRWDGALLPEFQRNLNAQKEAEKSEDVARFHQLDYDFHYLICRAAGAEFAFETISEKKAQIARLCVLSLTAVDELSVLVADHVRLFDKIRAKDWLAATEIMRLHLSRLDATVKSIYDKNAPYFEDGQGAADYIM